MGGAGFFRYKTRHSFNIMLYCISFGETYIISLNREHASVAQGIEQRFPVPCAGGSNPSRCGQVEPDKYFIYPDFSHDTISGREACRNYRSKGETYMKDKFREWLSDNLRYILLGIGIILVLVLIFFCVRYMSGMFGDTDNSGATSNSVKVVTTTPTPEATDMPDDTDVPETTDTPAATPEPENTLTRDSNAEIQSMVSTYFMALGNKDIAALKTVVDNLSETEQAQIEGDSYIEGYSEVSTYTFPGHEEGTYVVIASYNCKYRDINTVVPGLNQMYIYTDTNGNLVIAAGDLDDSVSNYMADIINREEVKKLIDDTQASYEAAVASDSALSAFIASIS